MYRRFLNKSDYLSIITDTALSQLVRDNENRFIQAEQAAEASIIDYLSENYEVEKELNRGKYIFDYNRSISYPIGSHFYLDGDIYETIQAINGYKSPFTNPYWHESEEVIDLDEVEPYSQMKDYYPGNVVKFLNTVYVCDIQNGFDFNDIRIPGINAWERVTAYAWDTISYNLWEVVQYNDQYFALISTEDYDPFVNPIESDCWGLIGNYDKDLDIYELSEHEYVVYEEEVYYPIINPNADKPVLSTNLKRLDPRNYNLKRHMVQLALYELHKLISPGNISSTRIDDYEHSMQWLKDASKLKLNPQIPRKVDERNKQPLTDWQMATFQTTYDPHKNPWQV
jgi:hypothetical protein